MKLKRCFDLLAALIALCLLAPLMLLVACWIRFDSPGPALFVQQRVGRHGVPFSIFKFRTMACDGAAASGSGMWPHPRITRAGHWLRRTKLDELPQLANVVLGQMSLVGPRPELARYVACYPGAVRDKVLSVPPGITEWSSIQYRDEGRLLAGEADPERTYIEIILPVKLAFYQRYVDQRSFWMDLRIIASTLSTLWR
jgi:lipopolysaccharide/colanic/teichoic acid biosynthesis glycosyltransferase